MSTSEKVEKPLDPRAKAYGDADLNQLLKSLETLENADMMAMLNYVQIIEKGVKQLKIFAVKKASETYMSNAKMADALDMSRQTFTNQMQNTLEKHRVEKKTKPAMFTNRLGETDQFIDGKLTKTSKKLTPASVKNMTDEQKMYFSGFCKTLNVELDAGNPNGVKKVFQNALSDGIIDPLSLKDIQQRADAFLAGEFDYDEFGEPISISKAEHEWIRLRALGSICGLTDRQRAMMARAKAKAREEAEKEALAHLKESRPVSPFTLFALPRPTPASSKLPDNLLEEWQKYQNKAKDEGKNPTRESFAKLYGVSRATFSRALKKAEEEANAQE